MPEASFERLLDVLLDSWDRNNRILVNLLNALPEGGLDARAMDSSPSVGQMLSHIHYVRLVLVFEDAPEFAEPVPDEEWGCERDRLHLEQRLNHSAQAVREAVRGRVRAGQGMDVHYDHPIHLLQHLLWHEGYHHGQIKLALKMAGLPVADDVAGPITWGVYMRRQTGSS
ncbi:MAG TPA: DinB family protein [Thermoanaerobaculia bacterium]|nr:DinB family protein [Thermoanaerobaculia bacterium]